MSVINNKFFSKATKTRTDTTSLINTANKLPLEIVDRIYVKLH